MTRAKSFISVAALTIVIAANGCDGSHASIGHNLADSSQGGADVTGTGSTAGTSTTSTTSVSGGAAGTLSGSVGGAAVGGAAAGGAVAGATSTAATGLSVSGPILVAVGSSHQCVSRGGYVWCWGHSALGQIGHVVTDMTPDLGFQPVSGLENVVEIASADSHTCARRSDGRVLCWGRNGNGEVGPQSAPKFTCSELVLDYGPNDLPCQPTPTLVPGIEGAVELALGPSRSCARLDSGAIRCWSKPQPDTDWAIAQSGATNAALGNSTACAVGSDGTLQCSDPRRTALSNIKQVSMGWGWLQTDTVDLGCALQGEGSVLCWGPNNLGQLGLATTGGTLPANSLPTSLTGARQVAVGNNFGCALLSNGEVKCWGNTSAGRDPYTAPRCMDPTYSSWSCFAEPQPVVGLPPASAIAVGSDKSCAVTQDDAVWCWTSMSKPLHIPGPWESGPPACSTKKQALAAQLLRAIDTSMGPCKTARDCTEVSLDLPCSHECASAPVSLATATSMQATLSSLAAQYCDGQCAAPAAACTAPTGELACDAGTCVRFDPVARGCSSPCECHVQDATWTDTIGCGGSDLYVFQTVPCVGCGSSKVTLLIANRGQTPYAGTVTATVTPALSGSPARLPAAVSQTISVPSGGLAKTLVLDVPEGPGVAYVQLGVPGDCDLQNNRDYVLEIPEVAQCK